MITTTTSQKANQQLHAHYLGSVPMIRILDAYTDEEAIAVFGRPTKGNIRFNLPATELMRLWSPDDYEGTLSSFLSQSMKLLKKDHPEIEIIIAYADPTAGHHGGIYQASNWTYVGKAQHGGPQALIINGETVHARTVNHRYGHASQKRLREELGLSVEAIPRIPKHLYYYPLTRQARKCLIEHKKPYWKDPLKI